MSPEVQNISPAAEAAKKLLTLKTDTKIPDYMREATANDAIGQIIKNSGCSVEDIMKAVQNHGKGIKMPEDRFDRAAIAADAAFINDKKVGVLEHLGRMHQFEQDRNFSIGNK